mgnify:CR=1 FL=1
MNIRKEKNSMAEKIMTIEECAKYLKTSVTIVYWLAQSGKITASKVGNQWRFRKEMIEKRLDKGTG